MISVLPRHIPLRGVSHCCHGCLQYTAISPDTHTRSGRLHSSHPPRSSPARLPAALHLALRSGVLGRCSPHHHPHLHPGETRERRPQEPPSTHITRGTPGFLPGSPPGDKPGFVTSPGFSQGYGKCGFLVFPRVALSGVVVPAPVSAPAPPLEAAYIAIGIFPHTSPKKPSFLSSVEPG